MPFDGNGVYSLPTNSFAQPVTDTVIADADAITTWADFQTALTLCCTKDGQTTTPTFTNPKILTKILDTNANELLEFGTTGSAVNHLKVTNAATGNVPTISTAGEADIGIDIENLAGEEMLQLAAIDAAVNNIKVTNAATGDPPTLSTSGESDIGMDFENSEGEEMLQLAAIDAAVNNIKVTNAITAERPIIASEGEADIGINFENSEGEELLELVATPTAVNNVVITNAATGDAAKIDVTETDTNLDVDGNGTGYLRTNAVRVHGMVILDTPEVLVASATEDSWTTVDSSTLSTAEAVTAIIKISLEMNAGTSCLMRGFLRKTGSVVTANGQTKCCAGTVSGSTANQVTGILPVNLDTSYDFDYYITSSAVSAITTREVVLVGYYV